MQLNRNEVDMRNLKNLNKWKRMGNFLGAVVLTTAMLAGCSGNADKTESGSSEVKSEVTSEGSSEAGSEASSGASSETSSEVSETSEETGVQFPVTLTPGYGSVGTPTGGTIKKNPYGDDYNCDTHFNIPEGFSEGLGGYQDLKLHVTGTVTSYVADKEPAVYLYAMDSKYENWNMETVPLEKMPQEFDITLDMKPYIWQGTLGEMGLKVTGCKDGSEVAWQIDSAQLEGSGSQEEVKEVNVELKYTLTGEKKNMKKSETAVGKHGKLSMKKVSGYKAPVITDKNGKPFQMRGVSTHGLSWFPQYVNKDAFQTFRDEWGVNLIRLAVYSREGENAYIQKWADKIRKDNGSTDTGDSAEYNDKLIMEGVKAATELGMYVIIDWHVLNYNPNEDIKEAEKFFTKYAKKYKDYDNVLFEICNEPTGTEWKDDSGKDLYTYCTKITKTIRKCGSDAIVICGTPSYSANVNDVIGHTLKDKNTIYTCHFYSASHYEDPQKRMTDALDAGVPVIVSEFGICTASGDGKYDVENADKWIEICDKYNVSFACWAISNSKESAAYFQTSESRSDGAWTEEMLTNTSKYIINCYREHEEKEGK